MLNRSILAELAALEARFEAGCLVCIDLIDSYDNVVYSVPHEWIEAINKNSMAVSKFARNAMEEKLKRDGLIK